jgi:hypothetical protein
VQALEGQGAAAEIDLSTGGDEVAQAARTGGRVKLLEVAVQKLAGGERVLGGV